MSPRQSEARAATAARLDGMDWPVALSIVAFGVHVGIRVSDERNAESLLRHLPPGATRGAFASQGRVYSLVLEGDDGGEARGTLYVDGSRVARHSLAALAHTFETHLQLYIAEMAPEHVFVHAGVVGWRGRAIVLPGRSYCGKTTLVAALVDAGADYYSDEYAAFDATGRVHAYARALSIRAAGTSGLTRRRIDAPDQGGEPLPVGLVVVSAYRAGAEFQPRRLSPGEGALALVANTVPARRVPERMLVTLERVVAQARLVSSDRGEAAAVAREILVLAKETESA